MNRKCNKIASLSLLFLFFTNYLGTLNSNFRYIKYGAFLFIIMYMIIFLNRNNIKLKMKNNDSVNFIVLGILFLFISFLFQINKGVPTYFFRTLEEVIFILLPSIYVFFISHLSGINFDNLFKKLLICLILMFIIKYNVHINISNILSISFMDSYSPFESEYADYFMLLFIYFIFRNNIKLSLLSAIFSYLCLKRFHILFMLFIVIINIIIKNNKVFNKFKSKFILTLLIIFNVGMTYILVFITTSYFESIFYNIFNISLNAFTLGRFTLVNYIRLNPVFYNNGFGSTSVIISQIGFENIHLDHLKIYFEMGLIGIFIFYYYFYKGVVRYPKLLFLFMFFNILFYVTFILGNTMSILMLLLVTLGIKYTVYKL